MADPFELRLFFSNRLRALNPCEDTAEDVVAFALKHRELDEDLWSCVLEQLERADNSINVRANICYFLEDLVELAKREPWRHLAYVRMVERDFARMIDAVIPLDGLGVVNVNCVRYVLHALHYEMGVFAATEAERAQHDAALGQTWETRTFEELQRYLEQRAVEARPDLGVMEMEDDDGDDESEPDMAWVDAPVDEDKSASVLATAMEVDGDYVNSRPAGSIATSLDMKEKDIVMPDPHDLPSPPGTRSPSNAATPLHTPRPPTPLSSSPSPSPSPRQQQKHVSSTSSPPSASTKQSGLQSDVTSPIAPKVFSPVKQSTTNENTNNTTTSQPTPATTSTTITSAPAAAPHSPSSYTPVQKEDANIFTPAYFELATERMEQDRERQRRKEDSSGFVAVAAGTTVDDEVAQLLQDAVPLSSATATTTMTTNLSKSSGGDSLWLEDLISERVVWGSMGE